MKIKVESESDSKGQETPTRFTLGTRTIEWKHASIAGMASKPVISACSEATRIPIS